MAINMDKSLSQAPQGLEELASTQPDLSIEIENPESVTLDDGSMEITITPGNYNFTSLASQFVAGFLANGHTFTITINKQTGVITFATPATNFILQVSSIFSTLGFPATNQTSAFLQTTKCLRLITTPSISSIIILFLQLVSK